MFYHGAMTTSLESSDVKSADKVIIDTVSVHINTICYNYHTNYRDLCQNKRKSVLNSVIRSKAALVSVLFLNKKHQKCFKLHL